MLCTILGVWESSVHALMEETTLTPGAEISGFITPLIRGPLLLKSARLPRMTSPSDWRRSPAWAATAMHLAAQAGSLKWTKGTYVDKVMSKAKKAGKPVFMIGGRETCVNTTTTRDQSCENASVRAALGDYFLWFCNCDEQRDDFWYYATPYSDPDPDKGIMLPLCAVINPNKPDVCVAATTGRQSPSDLLSLLDKAEKKGKKDDKKDEKKDDE